MRTRQVYTDLTEEMRSRTSVFVDKHEGTRVTVLEGNTVEFAGTGAADLFQAAADWMRGDPTCVVNAVRWEFGPVEPPLVLTLDLDRLPGAADA